jgi:hypothetical protein
MVPMVPSISVNSAFSGALRPKSGCPSEKRDHFHFLRKVVQTMPAIGFQCSINKHKFNQKKKLSPVSIDHGMAEIQAI